MLDMNQLMIFFFFIGCYAYIHDHHGNQPFKDDVTSTYNEYLNGYKYLNSP